MGLVSRLVDDGDFKEEVERVVSEIQGSSPLIIRLNKRAVRESLGRDFKSALAGVSDLFLNKLMKTDDTLEGLNSFCEKRKPVWKNK